MSHKVAWQAGFRTKPQLLLVPRELASITNPWDPSASQTQERGPCAPDGKGGLPTPGGQWFTRDRFSVLANCAHLELFLRNLEDSVF